MGSFRSRTYSPPEKVSEGGGGGGGGGGGAVPQLP